MPIHGPRGELAFFSVGSRRQEPAGEVGRSSELLLQLVGFNAYAALLERVARNAPGDSFGLTEHERQCLHWTARGKVSLAQPKCGRQAAEIGGCQILDDHETGGEGSNKSRDKCKFVGYIIQNST